MKTANLYKYCVLLGLIPGALSAADWIEFSSGSARLPGTMRLENFNSDLATANRVSVRPKVAMLRDGTVTLSFYSYDTVNRQASFNGIFTLENAGGGWNFLEGSENGAAFAQSGFSLNFPAGQLGSFSVNALSPISSTSANATELMTGFVGVKPFGFLGEGRAATYRSNDGWIARGDSLSDNGITGPSSFSEQVYHVGAALDSLGNPYLAWQEGSEDASGIKVSTFRFSTWQGLADSMNTPIVAAAGNATYRYPSIGVAEVNPVVAYTERRGTLDRIYLKEYDLTGGQWQGIGTSDTVPLGFGRFPKVVTFQDRRGFFVAWEDHTVGDLKVLERQGSNFIDHGDPLAPWGLERMAPFNTDVVGNTAPPRIASFDMALDRNGDPVVAFRAETSVGSGDYQIYVSFLDPGTLTWQAVGNPVEAKGASDWDYTLASPLPAGRGWGHFAPSLSVRADNTPVLAWEFDDGSPQTPVIFLKLLNEALNPGPPTTDAAIRRILGQPENNPNLDDNSDGVVDAADVERLSSRGL